MERPPGRVRCSEKAPTKSVVACAESRPITLILAVGGSRREVIARYGVGMGGCYPGRRRHRFANRWDAAGGRTPAAAMGAAARGTADGGGVGRRQSADGVTFGGPGGSGAGIADEGDKIFLFLAETLLKL